MDVVIIGYGTVGRNLAKELSDIRPHIFDKYKPQVCHGVQDKYDIGFICVDTPLVDGLVDITEVRNALLENNCDIYCIKSTVPVGTIDSLSKELNKKIVFSPEYYGATKHCNSYTFDFTILGGKKEYCNKIIQAILPCYDGRHSFRIVDAKTAELVKFMENSYLATKVSFCNSFYNVCKQEGLSYEELRELFILDPRVNPSHTFVYDDHSYWSSHCLDKDVLSIANQYDMQLIHSVIDFNNHQKEG